MKWMNLLFIFASAFVYAESPNSSDSGSGSASGGGSLGVSNLKPFEDRVFDLQPKTKLPATSKGLGNERYMAPKAEYNSGQRDEWLQICEPEKNVSSKAYQRCYDEQRKNAEQTVENLREKKPVQPLRNVPPKELNERKPDFDSSVEVERIYENE